MLPASIFRYRNYNLCGIDNFFCYPIAKPYDWDTMIQLPYVSSSWTIQAIEILDPMSLGALYTFVPGAPSEIDQFFTYVLAEDTNGNQFIHFRLLRPMKNYGGVTTDEIKCFAVRISMIDDLAQSKPFAIPPICWVTEFCSNHYTIDATPADIPSITFNISIQGGAPEAFIGDTIPANNWIDYNGTTVDLYLEAGNELVSATLAGNPLDFTVEAECFGNDDCQNYVTVNTEGAFNYDCNGNFYGVYEADTVVISNKESLAGELGISEKVMHFTGARVSQLAQKIVPQRLNLSCYIPKTDIISRYKIGGSVCPVPDWYMNAMNILLAGQSLSLGGNLPLVDEYNEFIPVVISDESAWRPRQSSEWFLPSIILEACPCSIDFTC